jgi:hypothetical protein
VLIVPVRHHSPAAALQVARLIRERRPRAVLVEGPVDADAMIPLLLDPETVPPVAIYAYRTGNDAEPSRASAVYYPVCHYSPEYAAFKTGAEVGATLRFCDVPASVALGWSGKQEPEQPETAEERLSPAGYAEFTNRLAEVSGFDSFDAFWEAAFEQACGQATADQFLAAFADFGTKARGYVASTDDDARDTLRERHMAAVAAEVAAGTPAAEIVLVCGAAHAGAIARWFEDGVTRPDLPESAPAEIALIPFSYPRLSEQSGYGAGNRAPWFYQQVWELEGDYAAASRRALVALGHQLRRQGLVASLAQGIDADRLAMVLAGMRGKIAAGVDEVVDAAVACYGQGSATPVHGGLREVLVGQTLGRVTPKVGRTPLQVEFHETAARLGLPTVDAPRQILVHMPAPVEAAQSVFLHRLTTAAIPFASELESGLGARGRAAQGGPLEQLARVREKWELCWTPATDARLVEQNAWGSTLVEVCQRLLGRRLEAATRIDEGTEVLLRLALCDLPGPFPRALQRCEALAADSISFPGLARAAFHLDGLLAYGAARRLPEEQLGELAGRLFVRAALQLPAAAICGDEAAIEVEATLLPLYELVRRERPTTAPELFWGSVQTVAEMEAAHPGLRGLSLTLLELGGRLGPGELARRLQRTLAVTSDAAPNARLVAGLFALHRSTLVRNRALIGAVTEFLLGLETDALVPLLPALRRSLGNLSAAERAYLTETLTKIIGSDRESVALDLELSVETREQLVAIDRTVAAVLEGWSEQYGIG